MGYRTQTIYYNGDILTMEGDHASYVEAILVENGRIKKVGKEADIFEVAEDDANKVNLKGKTLLPSFIDPHGHMIMVAQQASMADLSDCENFGDIIAVLQNYIEKHTLVEGQWLEGFGYDHTRMEEERHPTREILDQIRTEHPICIFHTSGHMGCVNSKALEVIGLTRESENPEGGVLGRDEQGELTGYLEEVAMVYAREKVQECAPPKDYLTELENAQAYYLKNGITTVQDGASTLMVCQLLHHLAVSSRLKVDVVAYPVFMHGEDGSAVCEAFPSAVAQYEKRFKIGGYKIVLDGSPQGKSAWLTIPYEGEKEYAGYPWMKEEEVYQVCKKAIEEGRQLLVHCNGDAAGDQFLTAYKRAYEESRREGKEGLRPTMIHCQTVREDQLDRMVELHMIPSIFVAHTYYWGDVHLKNLGEQRGRRISPVKSAMNRGMRYNFHQDPPVVKPLMLHTVWAAVNRITRKGLEIGPEQRIEVYDALKGVTINAAYAYFEEDSKGSIKEGKRADLVVLSKNPMKVAKEAIKEIGVLQTIKDGVCLYERMDEEALGVYNANMTKEPLECLRVFPT